MTREPWTAASEPWTAAGEPWTAVREPWTAARELSTAAREPWIVASYAGIDLFEFELYPTFKSSYYHP